METTRNQTHNWTKRKKLLLVLGTVLLVAIAPLPIFYREQAPVCPTYETFSMDFTNWSRDYLAANPGHAEAEQRAGWNQHLDDIGCPEAKVVLEDAVCLDCDEEGNWSPPE